MIEVFCSFSVQFNQKGLKKETDFNISHPQFGPGCWNQSSDHFLPSHNLTASSIYLVQTWKGLRHIHLYRKAKILSVIPKKFSISSLNYWLPVVTWSCYAGISCPGSITNVWVGERRGSLPLTQAPFYSSCFLIKMFYWSVNQACILITNNVIVNVGTCQCFLRGKW